MTSIDPLANLARIGQLHQEPPARAELEGLFRSGEARLSDARNEALALESRFDLAYNAAHALALAALRFRGYRPANRYVVFQALEHTLGTPKAKWRVLAKCHDMRNQVEYQGAVEVDERLVTDLVEVTGSVLEALQAVDPLAMHPGRSGTVATTASSSSLQARMTSYLRMTRSLQGPLSAF